MKRFAIFAVFGPLLMFLLVTIPAVAFSGVRSGLWEGLYLTYLVSAIPAVLTGLADKIFDGWIEPRWRTVATGFAAVVIAGVMLSFVRLPHFGLFAFFPAAACSWLSAKAA
jgi:hypothetical protein